MSFLDILKASSPMPKALEEEFEGRRASFEEKCVEDETKSREDLIYEPQYERLKGVICDKALDGELSRNRMSFNLFKVHLALCLIGCVGGALFAIMVLRDENCRAHDANKQMPRRMKGRNAFVIDWVVRLGNFGCRFGV
ncbi:hypothetical protein BKA61DRAFT_667417 [Leptodontidium sp. MPI-SDFR-AT-0119]|nr:hypothetical protein BKA61DRAFT_667417 [Leptodontidium sp. MPI-SDFR-AT-0119]